MCQMSSNFNFQTTSYIFYGNHLLPVLLLEKSPEFEISRTVLLYGRTDRQTLKVEKLC